jgi:thiol peroxidase
MGELVKVRTNAPDTVLIDNDMNEFKLSSLRGKVVVLAAVPSLDTEVCDLEIRRFNKEAVDLGSDVHVLAVSMDLPFAQRRWCGAASVKQVQTLSDYRTASFGESYGVLIKELRLLARAVVLIDREGMVRYVELVKEITKEPNYERLLSEIKVLL